MPTTLDTRAPLPSRVDPAPLPSRVDPATLEPRTDLRGASSPPPVASPTPAQAAAQGVALSPSAPAPRRRAQSPRPAHPAEGDATAADSLPGVPSRLPRLSLRDLDLHEDVAARLECAGASVGALRSMSVADLAAEVFDAPRADVQRLLGLLPPLDAAAPTATPAAPVQAAIWKARTLHARLADAAPSGVVGAPTASFTGAPTAVLDAVADLSGSALRQAIAGGVADAAAQGDPAMLALPQAWARHLAEPQDERVLGRVLALVSRSASAVIPLPSSAKGERALRRFVVPRDPTGQPARGDLRPRVDVERTAALVRASALWRGGFEPSASFTVGDDRARVLCYDDLERSEVLYHPATDEPLTYVDGKLLSAGQVNWAPVFLQRAVLRGAAAPLPAPSPFVRPSGAFVRPSGTDRGEATTPSGIVFTLPRAAWLMLARMERVRATFGDLVPAALATTEKMLLRALMQADAEDDLSDLQELARAVAYYAELDPDVLRQAEWLLSVPPAERTGVPKLTGLAAFRPARSTLG